VLSESAGGEAAPLRLMKRTRHSAEQIVKKLHEAATALAGGKSVGEVQRLLAKQLLEKLIKSPHHD